MLYYFDRNLLDEVVRQYASAYVTGPVYDDGDATPENPSDSMSDNVLTMDGTSAPVANDYVFSFEDCKSVKATHKETGWSFDVQPDIPFGEQATLSGVYTITETDEAGNETAYEVIVDHDAPALNVTLELYGTGTSQITVDPEIESTLAPYYCKSFRIDSVVDSDPWSSSGIPPTGPRSRSTSPSPKSSTP